MLHVRSHCFTLLLFQAELFRVQKQFDKAEPLYWEAIKILEESFGPEDIRYNVIIWEDKQFSISFLIIINNELP